MENKPVIHGYDYGTARAAHSPVMLDELRMLEQTVGWTKEDDDAIATAGEVLAGQEEAMVDRWRSVIGAHEHLAKWFFGADGKPDEAYKGPSKSALCGGSPIFAAGSAIRFGSIIRRKSGFATRRLRRM